MSDNPPPSDPPRYAFHEILGRGGLGVVYRATQDSLQRNVAAKKPRAEGPGAEDQLLHEALLLSELEHPNIVPVYDCGRDADGKMFYSMKLVKGARLEDDTQKTSSGSWKIDKLTREQNLEILLRVSDAVAF